MQINKNGIAVDTPKKHQKSKPKHKLATVQMTKTVQGNQQNITVPHFQPVQAVLTAYGWELR